MSRQGKVIQTLVEGFDSRTGIDIEAGGKQDPVRVFVAGIEGFFEIDAAGNVTTLPVGLSPELAYWIAIDLKCLDLLNKET